MIASLPMYWRVETAPVWQAFWRAVQDAAPNLGLPDLTPPEAIPAPWTAHWLRSDLALSMTCGLPFRTSLKDQVAYVGTLTFGLDTPAGHYNSEVIVRRDAEVTPPRLGRLAYNSDDSQSGWAMTQHAAPFEEPPVFDGYVETGSHAASLAAVATGAADVAYLDAVTWRLLLRHDPLAQKVRPLGPSVTSPGLPLITAKDTDPEPLRLALSTAFAGFIGQDLAGLGGPIGFVVLDPTAYHAVQVPKAAPRSK